MLWFFFSPPLVDNKNLFLAGDEILEKAPTISQAQMLAVRQYIAKI